MGQACSAEPDARPPRTVRLGLSAQKQGVLETTGAAERVAADHNVEIFIEPRATRADHFSVRGKDAAVEAARRALETQLHTDIPLGDVWVFTMDVPNRQFADVVGEGNTTVRRIEREGRAEVQTVPNVGVVVKGAEGACQKTVGLIELITGSVRVKRARGVAKKGAERIAAADADEAVTRVLFFPSRKEEADGYRTVDVVAKYLTAAVTSLDVCVTAISHKALADALVEVHAKGVRVRVIYDRVHRSGDVPVVAPIDRRSSPSTAAGNPRKDSAPRTEPSLIPALADAGIPCRTATEASSVRMLNAFAVVDDKIALNGSYVYTSTATHAQDDSLCILSEPLLVSAFTGHFAALWDTIEEDSPVEFSVDGGEYVPQFSAVTIAGAQGRAGAAIPSRVLFFPNRVLDEAFGRCTLDVLLAHLAGAAASIDVATHSLTNTHISRVLRSAASRGVVVRVISDAAHMAAEGRPTFDKLVRSGIDCRASPHRHRMRTLYVIVDGCVLLFGSWPWTDDAVAHAHANVTITGNPEALEAYSGRFNHQFPRLTRQKAFF